MGEVVLERGVGRGLLRQIGTVSIITALSQAAFLAANLLLGRNLVPSDFGRVDLANKIINLTAYLCLFGLNSALIRAVPLADLKETDWKAGIPGVAGVAAVITLAVSLLGGLIYHFSPLETLLIGLAGWLFGLTVGGSAVLSIERRFTLSQILLYLWRGILLVSAVGLLLAGALRTIGILTTYAAAGLLQVAGLAWAMRSSSSGQRPLPTARLVREGLLFFGLFLTSTLMLRLDAFLLAGLISKAALGRYAAASNIALTGYGVLSLGVAQVLLPRVASGDPLKLGRLLTLLIGLGTAAGAVLTLVGTPLIHGLYANRYTGDFTLLMGLFCLTGLTQVAYVVPSSLVGIRGSVATLRTFLLINILSVALNLGLNLWLIPRLGLEGAALATLLSWLWRLAWAAALARRLPVRPEAAIPTEIPGAG